MTLEIVVLSSLVVILSFFVRGLTGFGSGPIMVSFLLLFLDMKIVAPTAAVLAVLTGFLLLLTFRTRKWVRYDVLLILVPTYMVGIIVGTYGLVFLKSGLVKMLFGVFITIYALKILFEKKEGEAKEVRNYMGVIAAFFGGITGGLFSSGGPPVVLYLTRKISDKAALRATLVFLFLLMDSWRLLIFGYSGLINRHVLEFSLYLLPAFLIGNLGGSLLHIRINQVLFKRMVAVVLVIIGLVLLF
ncbi:MAG: sulfite exporter TauE/SafE family protein [Nitrospirae bacterium]|nr:sulfite exporter TauE/SafE family protein [Nitrospirota bacterium]